MSAVDHNCPALNGDPGTSASTPVELSIFHEDAVPKPSFDTRNRPVGSTIGVPRKLPTVVVDRGKASISPVIDLIPYTAISPGTLAYKKLPELPNTTE